MHSHPGTFNLRPSLHFAAIVALGLLLVGSSPAPAKAADAPPPEPPVVDTPPPPPAPETLEPGNFKAATAEILLTHPAVAAVAAAAPIYVPSGDPYGFTAWLNGVRAQYGLGAVGVDPNLSNWAAMNNGQQNAMGMGHHIMGPARRQNSGMGAAGTVWQMWMASPAHQAALLDPSISMIGIAAGGAYWTFNAY